MKNKVNITDINYNNSMENYENVSYDELDSVYNGSCSEILCLGVFEESEDDIFPHLISKVKHGGTIKLVGDEIYEICRKTHNREMSREEANKILYTNKRRCFGVEYVSEALTNAGFKIMKKRLEGFKYFVEAVRE